MAAAVAAARSLGRASSVSLASNAESNPHRVQIDQKKLRKALSRAEKAKSMRDMAQPETDAEASRLRAAIVLQQNFRKKLLFPERLHRDNLSQRLLFEWRLFYGAIRLLNQMLIFALLLVALSQSGDTATKRGIYSNLQHHFDFDTLHSLSLRSELRDTLLDLSVRSKDFFLLSSQYFEPSSSGGAVELIGAMEAFSGPKVIGGVTLSIQIPNFSFTCWMKAARQFKRGYIIRKRILPAGSGAELACWGWYLDNAVGPALHYGAHDYYDTDSILAQGREQHIVGLNLPQSTTPDVFQLLTLVVQASGDSSQAIFYRDLEELGRLQLPRPITDCFNNLEGVLAGDEGLTLGQLRFYPRAMTPSSIQEVYEGGAFLSDISTGSVPSKPIESDLVVMGRAMRAAFDNIEQSVADQQPRSEIDLVLQSVDSAASMEASARTSSDAPLGLTPINTSLVLDPLTGRDYTLLFEGPAKLSKPGVGEERYFDAQSFPDWSGTGVTFTMWYRHPPCATSSCGVYLLSAHPEGPDSSSRCWSIWIENQRGDCLVGAQDVGVYFDNAYSPAGYHYAVDIMETKFQVSHLHWRHLAYVFDETDDMWRFYLDGARVYEVPYGSPVKEAHCPGGLLQVSYGFRYPGWSYGLEYELYDMRAYVGAPLTPDSILAVAFGRTDPLGMLAYPRAGAESNQEWVDRVHSTRHMYRCTSLDSPVMKDNPWEDLYGHTCQWFHDKKDHFPGVCQHPEAKIHCPIACRSLQECFSDFQIPHAFFAWNSIRRIEARGSNGTVCLSSSMDADRLVEECKAWRSSAGWKEGTETWERDMSQRMGRRVNMTDCEELRKSIDPACAFNQAEVSEFTQEVLKNGGDYTMAFWIRPFSEVDSLYANGRFLPHVQLINTFNPPRHSLGWGHYGDGQNGAARMNTACPKNDVFVEALEIEKVESSGWSFLSFSRVNSTWNTPEGSQGEVATNLKYWQESSGAYTQCLFDDSSFFTGVEVNYPALVSPVMLIPAKVPFAKVQEIYYARVGNMAIREGPLMTNAERNATKIPVEKKDYASKSVLMAAPIIFTTRRQATSDCPFEYSTQWLQELQTAVKESQCATPYQCPEEVLRIPAATMACAGAPQTSEPFFGLEAQNFRGVGFADLLFSLTDSPFIYRDGELRDTSAFVDSLTETVDLIWVFFTPQYGLTSVMEVSIDLGGPKDVRVDVKISHYASLEGQSLTKYIVVQCMVLVTIVFMLIDVSYEVTTLYKHRNDPRVNLRLEIIKHVADIVTAVSVTAFVALRLPVVINTSRETKRILGDLTRIPWSSPAVSMSVKKETFFRAIEDLVGRIEEQETLDSFLMVILMISLLRIIQCTSLHPRLALLTGTVGKALDDFWHAALLIILMMASFAFIGTWRFGDELEEFATFEKSMQTEFQLMFGEFIQGWGEDVELQAFVVLYYLVMFMLVLNFLLAIIVEAYMGVRKEVETLEVEQEFLTDLWDTFRAIITARVRGWPNTDDLGTILGGATAKFSVGYVELQRTGMFDDPRKVGSFLRFYSRFDFLEPPEIDRNGRPVPKNGEERSEERVVRLMCEALGVKPKRLADLMATSYAALESHARTTSIRHRVNGQSGGNLSPARSPRSLGETASAAAAFSDLGLEAQEGDSCSNYRPREPTGNSPSEQSLASCGPLHAAGVGSDGPNATADANAHGPNATANGPSGASGASWHGDSKGDTRAEPPTRTAPASLPEFSRRSSGAAAAAGGLAGPSAAGLAMVPEETRSSAGLWSPSTLDVTPRASVGPVLAQADAAGQSSPDTARSSAEQPASRVLDGNGTEGAHVDASWEDVMAMGSPRRDASRAAGTTPKTPVPQDVREHEAAALGSRHPDSLPAVTVSQAPTSTISSTNSPQQHQHQAAEPSPEDRATTPPVDEEEDVFLTPMTPGNVNGTREEFVEEGTPPLDEDGRPLDENGEPLEEEEDPGVYVPVAHLSVSRTPESVRIEL